SSNHSQAALDTMTESSNSVARVATATSKRTGSDNGTVPFLRPSAPMHSPTRYVRLGESLDGRLSPHTNVRVGAVRFCVGAAACMADGSFATGTRAPRCYPLAERQEGPAPTYVAPPG